jgi:uncharacterized phiE125 gp8 family phage protein
MTTSLLPGEPPVSLNEARGWLRMGATADDAVVAGLVRAAAGICEAFIGQWLIVRAVEEVAPLRVGAARPGARLSARPVTVVDGVTLILPDGGESALEDEAYRVTIARDGTAHVAVHDAQGAQAVRIAYRAGMAPNANAVPEAIRQGIVRMVQYLHEARDGAGAAPPAAVAALWQPWRRLTLGSGR